VLCCGLRCHRTDGLDLLQVGTNLGLYYIAAAQQHVGDHNHVAEELISGQITERPPTKPCGEEKRRFNVLHLAIVAVLVPQLGENRIIIDTTDVQFFAPMYFLAFSSSQTSLRTLSAVSG
jgi:hypothetical protein